MSYDPTIAQEAINAVTGDRASSYGHPHDDFTKVAGMWSALFGWDCTPERVARAMQCIKMARQEHAPKRDNLVDLVGYALAEDAVLSRQAEIEAGLLEDELL